MRGHLGEAHNSVTSGRGGNWLQFCELDRNRACQFPNSGYDELLKRDKVKLDTFWLKDESPEDSANLPDRDVVAGGIAEDLEAALDQFSQIASDLQP